jgi:chromate transporter
MRNDVDHGHDDMSFDPVEADEVTASSDNPTEASATTGPFPKPPASTGPSAWQLFAIWAGIGLQSFGGGASTTLLIQRTFIERRGWLTIDEFTRLWNLSLLTPGINLIAVTVLIGKRLRGTRGILASLAGLLMPSATITCLLAALFAQVEQQAAVQAILRGVVPATAGILGVVMVNFARPLVQRRVSAGAFYRWGAAPLVVLIALAILVWNVSAVLAVLGAALLGIVFFAPHPASKGKGRAGRERKRAVE